MGKERAETAARIEAKIDAEYTVVENITEELIEKSANWSREHTLKIVLYHTEVVDSIRNCMRVVIEPMNVPEPIVWEEETGE
jgi:hypothetical protein